MGLFSLPSRILLSGLLLLVCLCPWLIGSAAGADVSIEGYLGETITLHGYSYVGDNVYLFLTGPNLPANGVTLTDVSQRADQGHFTVVPVDDNQEWSYNWETKRIEPNIDPGTYTVYVTNEPADLANLGGTSSYKTLSVYLQKSDISQVSINAGHSYTLRPESHTSTVTQTPSPPPMTTEAVTTPSSAVPETTLPVTPVPPPATTAKSVIAPFTPFIALLGCGCGILLIRSRQGNP